MAAKRDNDHEVAGIGVPPNVEGKDPHAAFSVFLAYTKRILRPAELGHLIRPRLQSLPDKERSIITTRDELRETCGPERQTIKDRLSQMANAVEVYCKANRSNPFLLERLGWLIQEVTVWDPEIIKSGDINFSNKEHLEENSERLRRDERMAGMDEFDKAVEVGIADGFVNAVFRTDELRAELAQHLKGIATSIAVDHVATNGTTATQGPTDRPIIWKGNPAELFALFEELVGKGWIELPKNRGKRSRAELARTVHAAFAFASGTIITEGTALNYVKKGRDGINEQRPEPRVVFTLKRNPDVGTDYDPDKAGE